MKQVRKGHFCFTADSKPVWIVSDVRRRTDICWFRENYGEAVRTIRVTADDDVRISRGWTYTPGKCQHTDFIH